MRKSRMEWLRGGEGEDKREGQRGRFRWVYIYIYIYIGTHGVIPSLTPFIQDRRNDHNKGLLLPISTKIIPYVTP